MKKTKLNSSGLTHLLVPLMVVATVALIGVYILVRSHAQVTNPNPLKLEGTVVSDGCAKATLPLSSSGCTITVANKTAFSSITPTDYVIKIVPSTANKNFPYGNFQGFGAITTDYTGYPVSVYAYLNGNQTTTPGAQVTYGIANSDAYYVRIEAQNITATITNDGCFGKTLSQLEKSDEPGCVMNINGSTTFQLFPNYQQVADKLPVGQLQNFFKGWTKTVGGEVVPEGLLTTNYTGYQISFFARTFNDAQPNSAAYPAWSIVGNSNYYAKIILPGSSTSSSGTVQLPAGAAAVAPVSNSQVTEDCSPANPAHLPAIVLNSPNCKLIVPLLF